jgi:hypothetical protein
MYKKIIFIIMITLSLMIISWCPYKNEIVWFLMIMIHHTIMTYKLIKNINTKWFLNFDNLEILSLMIIFTALVKLSIWYTNWSYIVNDMMWMDINPVLARIWVLVAVVLLVVVPMFIYDKKKK